MAVAPFGFCFWEGLPEVSNQTRSSFFRPGQARMFLCPTAPKMQVQCQIRVAFKAAAAQVTDYEMKFALLDDVTLIGMTQTACQRVCICGVACEGKERGPDCVLRISVCAPPIACYLRWVGSRESPV